MKPLPKPIPLHVKAKYVDEECHLGLAIYENGRLCVLLTSLEGEPLCHVSTNLPDMELEDAAFFAKTWSENEGIVESLIEQEVIELTGAVAANEYVMAPVCRFTTEFSGSLGDALDRLFQNQPTLH